MSGLKSKESPLSRGKLSLNEGRVFPETAGSLLGRADIRSIRATLPANHAPGSLKIELMVTGIIILFVSTFTIMMADYMRSYCLS